MKHSNVNVGSRAEVLAELDRYGHDKLAHGKEALAREYARAIARIENGATAVRVRNAVWYVTDGENSPSDEEICEAALNATAITAG